MKSLIICLLVLAACEDIRTTPQGIHYLVIDGAHLDINKIQAKQLDIAWVESTALWGYSMPNNVEVRFWDKPIEYNGKMYAGLTWDSEVNVYLKPSDLDCVFNSALLHEFGHIKLSQLKHNPDPQHMSITWEQIGPAKGQLEITYCY